MDIVWQVVGMMCGGALAAMTRRYWRGWGGRAHRLSAAVVFVLLALGCWWLGLAMVFSRGHANAASPRDAYIIGSFLIAGGFGVGYFALKAWRQSPGA